MFRDAVNKLSLRSKLLILAAVGVLLPLVALTYLQYRSLTELENKTKGAFKDTVRQGLTLVEDRMRQRLETIAAQTIGPIGTMNLSSGEAQKIEKYFADVKQSHPEVDTIFAFASQNAYLYSNTFQK